MKLSDLLIEDGSSDAPGMMLEMANLTPADTGLPVVVWFGRVGGRHGPRLKVCNRKGKMIASDSFIVAIRRRPYIETVKTMKLPPKEVQKVLAWVKLNYDQLMVLWDIYESGVGNALKELPKLKPLKSE